MRRDVAGHIRWYGLGHVLANHPVNLHDLAGLPHRRDVARHREVRTGLPVTGLAGPDQVRGMRWLRNGQPVPGLEQPVPVHFLAEHGAAQHQRVPQRCSLDVLDDVRDAAGHEPRAHRRNQVRVGLTQLRTAAKLLGPALARRRHQDDVVAFQRPLQHVAKMELERVPVLRPDVDPGHPVPCAGKTCVGATLAAAKAQHAVQLPSRTECPH